MPFKQIVAAESKLASSKMPHLSKNKLQNAQTQLSPQRSKNEELVIDEHNNKYTAPGSKKDSNTDQFLA